MAQRAAKYVNAVLHAIKQRGGSAIPAEVYVAVAKEMRLEGSPVLQERTKRGDSKFENEIQWVREYLCRAGILDRSKRGVWTFTQKGMELALPFSDQQIKELLRDARQPSKAERGSLLSSAEDEEGEEPPEEFGYEREVLDLIGRLSPGAFERLCQRLLRESGFEQVEVIGGPRDGGIDGIGVLRVNAFVTFKVFFQCKRYTGSVGPSIVRDFRGAMQGRADKGIILTTGEFSAEARKEAVRDGVPPIELTDGEKLVELFESLQFGLVPRKTFDLDREFFGRFEQE